MARKLPGRAIQAGTITVTQLETTVATTVQTGGGPKLTNIQITDNTYTVLDDTAVDITGGYIKITGTGFVTGCSVIVGQLPAASVTFISSTEVRAQLSAQAAGTYIVYLVNPDGGVGIRVNGVTHSASPAWQTASALPEQYDGVVISLSLIATEATSYVLTSGSLPPGTELNSNTGVISGTVTGISNDTTYTFTVTATDAQLQNSPRTFTVTITISEPYFKLTTLLLGGQQSNTAIKDTSVNNFNLSAVGDSRASNFNPYNESYSIFFDGTGDYLTLASDLSVGTSDFTIEAWVHPTAWTVEYTSVISTRASNATGGATDVWVLGVHNSGYPYVYSGAFQIQGSAGQITLGSWQHLAVSRQGSTMRLFVNGILRNSATTSQNYTQVAGAIGANRNGTEPWTGFISNLRLVVGTALYTANFTPATTSLTSVSGTRLLTGQSNRFLDNSSNNFSFTSNGDVRIVGNNPFNITNTTGSGSVYFDGTGDYLSFTNTNNQITFGTGDFTIEFWVNFTNPASTSSYEIVLRNYTADPFTTDYFYLGKHANATVPGAMSFWVANFSGSLMLSDPTLPRAEWTHFAVVRNGNNWSLYRNGVAVHTVASSITMGTRNNNECRIGESLNGYISNLRVVKGTAVYTSNFTPPTGTLTAVTNTSLLTCTARQPHNNHGFQDSSVNQFLITRNGNATQGSLSPFSPVGWSVQFSSSDQYLQTVDAVALEIGSNDFQIDSWVYLIGYAVNNLGDYASTIICKNVPGDRAWQLEIWGGSFGTTTLALGLWDTANTRTNFTYGYNFVLNTWYNIRANRVSNVVRLFLDGIQVSSTAYSSTVRDNAGPVKIGNAALGGGYSFALNGYISNLSLSIGGSDYSTGGFTPALTTTPTNRSGQQLLTCISNRFIDVNTNVAAKTLTVSGTPAVRNFSPFAPTAVYNPVSHGGSAYFDGTGDYLNLGGQSAFVFGTGNWTIEFWMYTLTSGGTLFDTRPSGTGGTTGYGVIFLSSNTVRYDTAGAVRITGSTSVVNTWAHVALCKASGTTRLFINGIQDGSSYTDSVDYLCGANRPIIASDGNSPGSVMFTGYLSNYRIIKGTALYTANFTPPTAPLTAATNTQLLLNFTDAAIIDSTGRTVIETVADAKSSSVITKFTGASMYFDGTGDRLVLPASPNLTFGTSDFTIEMWVNSATQASNSARIMGNGAGGSWGANKWIFTSTTAGNPNKYTFQFWNYNSGGSDLLVSSSTANNSTWTHVAITRSGSTFRMFVNGTLEATQTSANSLDGSSSVYLEIGRSGLTGEDWAGYINDLRITRGYARYTANFTAPTAPHRLK